MRLIGPALGPDAARVCRERFWTVNPAASPTRLGGEVSAELENPTGRGRNLGNLAPGDMQTETARPLMVMKPAVSKGADRLDEQVGVQNSHRAQTLCPSCPLSFRITLYQVNTIAAAHPVAPKSGTDTRHTAPR